MITDSQSGEVPEYYRVAKAALYWGISPMEAITMPNYWIDVAEIISTAEREVNQKRRRLEG